jgi:hypothetical protein
VGGGAGGTSHYSDHATIGRYRFYAGSGGAGGDCDGGATVVASAGGAGAPPHALIAAMASLGSSPAHALQVGVAPSARQSLLSLPKVAIA